jgi:hypothetical protein
MKEAVSEHVWKLYSESNYYTVAQWVKNLDQKISMKIHTPDDRELKRLGGRVLQT